MAIVKMITSRVICLFLAVLAALHHSTTASTTPIGANVDSVDYRVRSQPFVNLIRQAMPFMSLFDPSTRVPVNSEGWPTTDFSVDLQTMGISLQGAYKISWVGTATVHSLKDGVITATGFDVQDGASTATLTMPSNGTDISLSFTNTSGGITDLVVLTPGATDPNGINPRLLATLERYSSVRLLPLLNVNRDFITKWSERVTPDTTPSWSNFCCPTLRNDSSVPYEGVVQMANAIGKDFWLNLPIAVDDDFYLSLAKLLKESVNSDLAIMLEFGNEMWNGGFPSQFRNREMAVASVEAGDPYHLDYDHCNESNLWGDRLVAYSIGVRIPKLFAEVFGESNVGRGGRIRPLLVGQRTYAKYMGGQLEYLEANYPESIDLLHAFAVSMYFDMGDSKAKDNLSGPEVLAALNQTLQTYIPTYRTQHTAHATLQQWYNQPLFLGYEGGPATFGGNSVPGKVIANESPLMQGLVEEMYRIWHSYGFSTMHYFHAGAQDYNWEFGQWSTHTDLHQPITAKTKGLDAIRDQPKAALEVGLPLPVTHYNMSMFVGYYEKTPGEEHGPMTYIVANSSFFYLLRSARAADYSVTLYTSTALTDCAVEVGFSSASLEKPVLTTLDMKPSSQPRAYDPQEPITIHAPQGLSVIRVRATADGDCAKFNPSNNRTTTNYALGWMDIHTA